jgi:hypothetical protein
LEAKEPNRSTHSLRFFFVRDLSNIMNSDFRAVLIALIIVIVIFAIGMGGHFFAVTIALRQMTYWHDEILNTVELAPELLS